MSTTPGKKSRGPTFVVLFLVVAAVAGAAAYGYFVYWKPVGKVDHISRVREGLIGPADEGGQVSYGLAKGYEDKDGDFVADPPPEAERLDPPVLRFAALDPRQQAAPIWKGFLAHLREKTGKKVELVEPPLGTRRAYEALQAAWKEDRALLAGKGTKEERQGVHIAVLNTGAVPLAVNRGGFVPLCLPADKDGKWGYRMEVLVPGDSTVQYPPLCVGRVHYLKKELADRIDEAFRTYTWDSALKAAYEKAGQERFVAITYKEAFAGVRAIDEALLALVQGGK